MTALFLEGILMTLHFDGLNLMSHFISQPSSAFRSSCSCIISLMIRISLYNKLSSAKRRTSDSHGKREQNTRICKAKLEELLKISIDSRIYSLSMPSDRICLNRLGSNHSNQHTFTRAHSEKGSKICQQRLQDPNTWVCHQNAYKS
jgi:hypothetical protein